MGSVYVYSPTEKDFTTIGICGALKATSCVFNEVANGKSSVTLEHPLDDSRLYTCLIQDYILKVDVPVRTTPEISSGQFVTVVERYRVKSTALKNDRYIYNRRVPDGKRDKKQYLVPVGKNVVVVAKYADNSDRWKVKYTYTITKAKKKSSKTVTGYMAHDSNTLELVETRTIPDTPTGIETVAPSWDVEEQLFRITSVQKTDDLIRVQADHISYDLMRNLTSYEYNGERTLQQAADGILNGCFDQHDFTFQTNVTGAKTGFHFSDKDPITALLDPEVGVVPRWDCQLVRNNFELVALDEAGTNRGMMFMYGKNIAGIDMDVDISNVATAVRPVGETEDGKPLYLAHSVLLYIDSSGEYHTQQLTDTNGIVYGTYHHLVDGELTCDMACARIWSLEGEDCKENKKDGPSASVVRNRLLEQAVDMLKSGAETPQISVSVDMQMLSYTKRWDMYSALEKVFLFDTVGVRHIPLQIDVDVTVSEIEWDCLTDRPIGYTLGTVSDLVQNVASWQIQSLNGTKISGRTIGAAQMADNAISARTMQAESIVTEALAANSVTANKIAAGSVTAEKFAAGAIDANVVTAMTAKIQSLTAESIHTDALAAAMAAFTVITAGESEFDRATIQHLVAEAMNLRYGVGEDVFIDNLRVAYAQMVSATIGNLCIKATNGNYYLLDVGTDGTVTATQTTVTPSEEEAGQKTTGEILVASEITADSMTTSTLLGTFALINRIQADTINVDQIFAREAFITNLRTSNISSESGVTLTIGGIAEQADAAQSTAESASSVAASASQKITDLDEWVYRFGNGLRIGRSGSKYNTFQDDTGFNIQQEGVTISKFAKRELQSEAVRIGKTSSQDGLVIRMAYDGGIEIVGEDE